MDLEIHQHAALHAGSDSMPYSVLRKKEFIS